MTTASLAANQSPAEHMPPADLRCCYTCAHWQKKQYLPCQCSGSWGGNIQGDENCTWRAKSIELRTGKPRDLTGE